MEQRVSVGVSVNVSLACAFPPQLQGKSGLSTIHKYSAPFKMSSELHLHVAMKCSSPTPNSAPSPERLTPEKLSNHLKAHVE